MLKKQWFFVDFHHLQAGEFVPLMYFYCKEAIRMVFVGREREDHRPRCEKPGPGVISTGGTEKNKCDAELFVACFVKNLNFSRHA